MTRHQSMTLILRIMGTLPTQVTTDPYSIGLDDLDTTVPPNFKPGEDDPYVFLGDTPDF